MTKILKKVQLSTEQSTPKSADPTKGTPIKPFTQEEMTQLQKEGMWDGGYVEGMGYVVGFRGELEEHASPSIVYPDNGTVLYPGIYVPRGSYHDFHASFETSDIVDGQVHLSWLSGYTGTGSCGVVPDWWKSNISAQFVLPPHFDYENNKMTQIDGPTYPADVFWKKITSGVYSIGIKFKYYCYNYIREEEDDSWQFADCYMGSVDTEIPYDPDLKRGYPI